jgi:hypothetical protein
MVRALFDTNVLIDYLNGVGAAKKELARYEYRAISPRFDFSNSRNPRQRWVSAIFGAIM